MTFSEYVELLYKAYLEDRGNLSETTRQDERRFLPAGLRG